MAPNYTVLRYSTLNGFGYWRWLTHLDGEVVAAHRLCPRTGVQLQACLDSEEVSKT